MMMSSSHIRQFLISSSNEYLVTALPGQVKFNNKTKYTNNYEGIKLTNNVDHKMVQYFIVNQHMHAYRYSSLTLCW